MLLRRTCVHASLLIAATGLLACGSEGGDDDDDIVEVRCELEDRKDTYAPGMIAGGADSQIKVRLVESTPAPPAKGDNTWIVDVLDFAAETPLDGATLSVTPFMPDHGHGTPVQTEIAPTGTTGQFQVDRVNLWMPGLWEITLEADTGTGTGTDTDAAKFKFCIEG